MPQFRKILALAGLALTLACGGGPGGDLSMSKPPPATPADPNGWTGSRALEASPTLNSAYPSVAVDASGDGFAAWQKQVSSSASTIWANQAAPATGAWGTDSAYATVATSDADVRVAAGGGGFWYAWDATADGTHYAVYASATAVGGTPGLPVQISTGNSYAPALAVNASGAVCAAWIVEGATQKQIWASQFDPGAATWSAPLQISTTSTTDALFPQVALDSAGDAVILWSEGSYGAGGPYVAKLATFVPGSVWSAPATLLAAGDRTDSYMGFPGPLALAMTDAGALAAWAETADGNVYTIRAARWTAAGGLGTPALVSAPGGYAVLPAVGLDGLGNAVAAWTTGGSLQYAPTGLATSTCAAAGTWQAPHVLLTSPYGVDSPVLALNASGAGVLAFNQEDGNEWRVSAATFTPGTGFGQPVYIQAFTGGDAQAPAAATGDTGQSLVVWTQADGTGATHIYGNYFN